MQVAGYGAGNGSTNAAQGGAGVNWGGFSGDVIYSWIENGVIASTIPSAIYPLNSLRATLSNNSAIMLTAKYNFDRLTVYGGYEHINYLPPSRGTTAPFYGVGGYYFSYVVINAYTADPESYIGGPKLHNVFWTGFKLAVSNQIDLIGAYYHYLQNDYSGTGCSTSAHPSCSGQLNAFSGAIEWRPVKRLDVYAGVMYSQVIGGLANGYLKNTNVSPTVGLRLRF